MQMSSRDLILLKILFGAFHINSRNMSLKKRLIGCKLNKYLSRLGMEWLVKLQRFRRGMWEDKDSNMWSGMWWCKSWRNSAVWWAALSRWNNFRIDSALDQRMASFKANGQFLNLHFRQWICFFHFDKWPCLFALFHYNGITNDQIKSIDCKGQRQYKIKVRTCWK